ncbi:hypothetical protein [Pseudidiomarina andamanensis]|uniref:Uncharacterized protein n=1 Tax=Pseudidiomarina andamanensis TaxID=1940690 RepID=A0AA92IMN2_9GAMM|nr:hypothetical protein [Pseudidiomarina andamanensis]MDS0217637.1 hypothetical protein [Pseudidiomarina andamanensis]QGT96628.1 hypothetical protein D3795_10895 [Pseudidiomarina andamanensis]
MNTSILKGLFLAAAITSAAPVAAESVESANMQVYRFVYSAERAVGSWDHSVDVARNDIRNETASDIKSESLLSLQNSGTELRTQFGYAIYIPEPKPRLIWKKLV